MSVLRRALLPLLIAAGACVTRAVVAPQPSGERWVATWASSQLEAPARPLPDSVDRRPIYANRTVRQVIHTSIGGNRVRIHLSNEYGDRPLVIGAAHVALRDTAGAIVQRSDRAITFGGSNSVVIRPGAAVVSDGADLDVPALSDLAVSVFISDSARANTRHSLALQTNYLSREGSGDVTAAPVFAADTMRAWIFLCGVDVVNPAATGVIVAIGNSITDGTASTPNTNRRWPNVLAERLLRSSEFPKGVVDAGISGNRVLSFGTGPSALARFDRDVLMVPGVTHVIVLEGINDVGRSANPREPVSANDIIFGLRQLAQRAHERGLIIFGATLTPASPRQAFTDSLEAKRQAVNAWIRTGGAFDGVIDFDAVTRDPANPRNFKAPFDSGDHLHPSDAGYKAMGEGIDLALFRRR
jgi:lysophospholipase L1-like esterase